MTLPRHIHRTTDEKIAYVAIKAVAGGTASTFLLKSSNPTIRRLGFFLSVGTLLSTLSDVSDLLE